MFAGKKSAQIREILISESAWEEMTCLFAPSLVRVVWYLELIMKLCISSALLLCMNQIRGCLVGQWLLWMGCGTIQMNRWSVHSKTGGLDNAQNTKRDTAP